MYVLVNLKGPIYFAKGLRITLPQNENISCVIDLHGIGFFLLSKNAVQRPIFFS